MVFVLLVSGLVGAGALRRYPSGSVWKLASASMTDGYSISGLFRLIRSAGGVTFDGRCLDSCV